jgi:hypothetical protein
VSNFTWVAENGKIHEIDLTATILNPIKIATTSPPFEASIAVNRTDLYYTLNNNNTIEKIDLTNLTATPETILTGSYNMYGLSVNSGYLYYATPFGNTIERINLSSLNPTIDTILYDAFLKPIGMYDLYFTDFDAGEIRLCDLSQSFPVTSTAFQTGITGTYKLTFDGNDLYCSAFSDNKIVKIDIFPVSTNSVKEAVNWTVFPNPTQESLMFDGLETTQNYMIIDAVGKIV